MDTTYNIFDLLLIMVIMYLTGFIIGFYMGQRRR